MNQLQGHSITYRIAVGSQQGHKVFTLQTIPSWEDDFDNDQVGKIAGFCLHAGVATKTRERKKIERLCRYIARPAVSEKGCIDDIDAPTFTSIEGYPHSWGTSKRWVIPHYLANSGGVYETKNSLYRPGCR